MIELQNLSKSFNGKTVVENLNLQINPGEIVGLLGPNGAGKTTTIRMIAGTLPPSQGTVLVNRHNLFIEDQEKAKIGYLPEGNPLYENLTVAEHLHFWSNLKGVNRDSHKIDSLIKTLGLTEVYYRPISQLSKGFRQRVGLSQALLKDPEVLLLDEPTEGLDPNQRQEIETLFKNLKGLRTVLICSHVLSEVAKMCQRVVIINQGRIVADDSVEHLTQISQEKQLLHLIAQGERIYETLLKIPGVTSVNENPPGHFLIEAAGSTDLRPLVFEASKKSDWKLLELSQERISLEEVFANLTK